MNVLEIENMAEFKKKKKTGKKNGRNPRGDGESSALFVVLLDLHLVVPPLHVPTQ
jgi:hypothetical protein